MTVYLVGAGPGDPELLTMKAARLVQAADTIVYDRLVSPEILSMAPLWAELIDVGKDPNGRRVEQVEINQILIDRGAVRDTVVRLKGGDPFVFGRGGEEFAELAAAGIAVEVVPGISSSVAGPALANIPVTHRGVSSAFTVLTGHQDLDSSRAIDWDAAVRLNSTLVVMMGAARSASVRDSLLQAGADRDTAVAVIVEASTPNQRTYRMKLKDLGANPIPNPAVIVIGDVADETLTRVPAPAPDDQTTPTRLTTGVLPL